MFQLKPILAFLGRFALVFAVLAVPWPGWPETYAKALRTAARALYGSFGAKGVVLFKPNPSGGRELDTMILVGNRDQLDAQGRGKAAQVPFNSRYVAYLPTALVVALVLATGLSWRRRLPALGWGLLAAHVFIAWLIWLMIVALIDAQPWLNLLKLSPFWHWLVGALHEVFHVYLGARFAVAVLIWILVTFRRDDWSKLLKLAEAGTGPARLREQTPRQLNQ
jgi:hypothetical protein